MKRKIIAITGGIGSGKSAVAKILQDCGYTTVDCDQLSKKVANMPQVVEQVANLLGKEYIVDGKLDRKAIRNVVFANKELLSQYNQIFFDKIRQLLVEQAQSCNGTLFVEIPLIDAFDFCWDEIWLVQASTDTQIARVTARDGVTQQNVCQIMANQPTTQRFTSIIYNNGSLTELRQQVLFALEKQMLVV